MNRNAFSLKVLFLLIAVTTFSCVEDVDFSQTEDLVLTPVFEADFVYSRIQTSDVLDIDTDIVIPVVRDTIDFDVFSTDFAIDNLERMELFMRFDNTMRRDVQFTFHFTGDDYVPLHSFDVIARKETDDISPVITETTEIFDKPLLNNLINSSHVITEVRVIDTTGSLEGEIGLQSKATYFVRYQS